MSVRISLDVNTGVPEIICQVESSILSRMADDLLLKRFILLAKEHGIETVPMYPDSVMNDSVKIMIKKEGK